MTDRFPAEPETKCEFCGGEAKHKFRIMRKVKGKKPNARVATGFYIFACNKCEGKAKRQAAGGVAPTHA